MSEASKYYSGDYSKLTDEELLKLYDQSILRYSYDGKLLEKTNAISYENGKFRTVQKAWISDGKLNLLERVIERNGNSESDKGYLLNGEELTVPDPRGGNEDRFSIEDLYTTNGYKLFSLYDSTWQENILFVVRPDGTQYEPEFYDLFRLERDGFLCCLLKGQGNAEKYPNSKVFTAAKRPICSNTATARHFRVIFTG